MTTAIAPRPTRRDPRGSWLVPTGLILLTLIPILAGAARFSELTGGAVETASNARFVEAPIPVLAHIVSVTIFSVLGAFQFLPALRRRPWHRLAGRILLPAGIVSALSGIWMVLFTTHAVGDGIGVSVLRLIFGTAMIASLALGVRAIIRRDIVNHGAWMTRGYAIGVAAGTQALVLIPQSIAFGPADEVSRAVFMGGAWVLNLLVAELVIRRRAARRAS